MKAGGGDVRTAPLSLLTTLYTISLPVIRNISLALQIAGRLKFNTHGYHLLLAKSGVPKAWSRFGLRPSSVHRKDSPV